MHEHDRDIEFGSGSNGIGARQGSDIIPNFGADLTGECHHGRATGINRHPHLLTKAAINRFNHFNDAVNFFLLTHGTGVWASRFTAHIDNRRPVSDHLLGMTQGLVNMIISTAIRK